MNAIPIEYTFSGESERFNMTLNDDFALSLSSLSIKPCGCIITMATATTGNDQVAVQDSNGNVIFLLTEGKSVFIGNYQSLPPLKLFGVTSGNYRIDVVYLKPVRI